MGPAAVAKPLDNFFIVTNKYSKTKYFKEAISGIERAYTSLGKIEDYLAFVETCGFIIDF